MSAMLGVVADEDDDAEGAMGRPKKQQPTKGKGAGKTDALQIKYHTEVKGIFKDDEERHAWQLKVTGKESTKDWNATNFASAMNALRIKKLNPQVRGAEQHTTIVQLLDKLPSYTDADAPNFLDAASALIQRTISHIDELTDSEAKTVIEGLKGAVKKEGEK